MGIGHELPDIPRLYTALAEWLACIVCILQLKPRFGRRIFWGISAAVLVVQGVFLWTTGNLENVWWILCMILAVGIMYLFILGCGEVCTKTAAYYAIQTFVAAEFAASLEWQLECYFHIQFGMPKGAVCILFLMAVYAAVYAAVGFIYKKGSFMNGQIPITNQELISCTIIGFSVFLVSNLGFVTADTPFSGRYREEIFNIRTIVDLGGIAILYAYHLQCVELRVRNELESVKQILQNQFEQYQRSQEAIEMINYKYHDLKHYILALRSADNSESRNACLDRMEEEIRDYGAQSQTGHEVLDTILTAKQLTCMKNQIMITTVLDGSAFSFMDTIDICSIFGNALDNAIECELKISNPQNRLIHVYAGVQRMFLIIRFENYCEDELELKEDLPVSTKKDRAFHGYGLKSLRYTVRKYGGEVDISKQNNWFYLKILIPIEQ